ncbi:hypothetical protein MYX06_01640 [Patescibacteria group bacterium AH-259-L05]|nr:hypothetical protein [Patescibacteria group bacterium AH-259-L05]
MQRAVALRRVANHVTRFRLGQTVFAQPIGAEERWIDNKLRPVLILEWIENEIVHQNKIHESRLERVLLNAGLPTWSIAKTNPLAYEDMRKVNDAIIYLDYESVLPNLVVGLEEHWMMLRGGLKLWPLDFVHFERLRQELAKAQTQHYEYWNKFKTRVDELEILSRQGGFL